MTSNGDPCFASLWSTARFELKCVAGQDEASTLTRWLDEQPLAFRPTYPARTVQSLYFDSMQFGSVEDNLAGIADRTKVRVRWYGDSTDVRHARFEVKWKKNRLGVKISHPVELHAALDSLPFTELTECIRELLPAEAKPLFERMSEPVLTTRYRRRYFESGDGQVRATLDGQIQIFDQYEFSILNADLPAISPEVAILEVKYPASIDSRVRASMESLPTRLSRFSKYTVGVQALLGV